MVHRVRTYGEGVEKKPLKIDRGWLVVIGALIVFGIFGAVDFIHKDTSPAPTPDPSLNMTH